MKKVIGFIPCRSGSKRIIDKNISIFNSESLIQNAYDNAENANCIDHIVVSTNSSKYIKNLLKGDKFLDIGLRSNKNSTDSSTDMDVLVEVIEKLKNKMIDFEYIIHLRPTYPALTKINIEEAFKFFQRNLKASSLKSVEKMELYYQKCFIEDIKDPNKLISLDGDITNNASSTLSQRCQMIYAQTAAIDIYRRNVIESGKLWGDYCLKYEFGNVSADIDTYFDYPKAYSSLDQLEAKSKIEKGEQIEICCDIDGVLFSRSNKNNYYDVYPNKGIIRLLQFIKKKGCRLILHTARGVKTGKNWEEVTRNYLKNNKIPFDELRFGKPSSDFYIDDKSISIKKLAKMFSFSEDFL